MICKRCKRPQWTSHHWGCVKDCVCGGKRNHFLCHDFKPVLAEPEAAP